MRPAKDRVRFPALLIGPCEDVIKALLAKHKLESSLASPGSLASPEGRKMTCSGRMLTCKKRAHSRQVVNYPRDRQTIQLSSSRCQLLSIAAFLPRMLTAALFHCKHTLPGLSLVRGNIRSGWQNRPGRQKDVVAAKAGGPPLHACLSGPAWACEVFLGCFRAVAS